MEFPFFFFYFLFLVCFPYNNKCVSKQVRVSSHLEMFHISIHSLCYVFYKYLRFSKVWLPWWLSIKNTPDNAADSSWIPGSGRYPEGRNGNPLQYSCLKNVMDRGAWQATVCVVAKQLAQLSNWETTKTKGGLVWSLMFNFMSLKIQIKCAHFQRR